MKKGARGQVMRQTDWSTLSLSLQWIYEDAVPADGCGHTVNPDLSALLLLKGTARVVMKDGRLVEAGEGQWLFLPPGQREQVFSADALLLSLTWRARWPDGRPLFDRGLPIAVPASEHPELRRSADALMRLVNRSYGDVPIPAWRSRASARITADIFFHGEIRLLQWLGHVVRILGEAGVQPAIHDIPDDRVLSALDIMETIPLRRMLTVPEIARKVGLSESQFKRLFVRHFGHSPSAHLRDRCLTEARHLLGSNDLPIKEVAYLLGFPSQSAFYNWFKKHEGIRPGAVPPAKQPA
ncbi:MAG: helix-turn-helix transcriptional regulator [Opitutales bacterium]|nr:helix-turn-helix transcriptional regulator [Opitutales bacterium]